MSGAFFTHNYSLLLNLSDPGAPSFGAALVLFGSAITLACLLRRVPSAAMPLFGVLVVIEFLFLGMFVMDVAVAGSAPASFSAVTSFQELFATHRWILFQLPVLLIGTASVILAVYRERIAERHASEACSIVLVSVWASFAAVLAILFEALI